MVKVRALALDFGGTLAHPGPYPDGITVTNALRGLPGVTVPDAFSAVFEAVTRRSRQRNRAQGVQVLFAEQLALSAHECGAVIPDLQAAAEAVFTALPDARVDIRAAETLRHLHDGGLVCVLACNTQRPESIRRRTLQTAGIADCFDALVLSSTIGLGKPHPYFYGEVVRAAGCQAAEILFIGDTPTKDAIGPHTYGMRAVLITTSLRPDDLPDSVGVIGHFTELPSYLESLGDDY